jgi:deaminated glutathione amidase
MQTAKPTLEVAVCQLTSNDDLQANLQEVLKLLERLERSEPGRGPKDEPESKPDLVCFPENALYFRMKEGQPIPGIEPRSEVLHSISQWSKKNGSVVHLGSVPLKRAGRLYNSSIVLTPDGGVHDNYQKIHLFDVDVAGAKPVRESDVFSHGTEPSIFDVKGWKIGSSICYDLRFAELYLHYAKLEVDVLLIPAAFLVPTGQAHWEVLTRARAIECQAYVLAAAQGEHHHGVQGGGRATYGHSMIIDPWGTVVAQTPSGFSEEQRILRTTLSRERIAHVRAQIPMKNHRRLV